MLMKQCKEKIPVRCGFEAGLVVVGTSGYSAEFVYYFHCEVPTTTRPASKHSKPCLVAILLVSDQQ
jgi:hypothetical protein